MSKPSGGQPCESGRWPTLLPIGAQKHVPVFPLSGTAYLFGSRPPAHVALKSRLVSKSHVIVINDRGESYLRDLASTNGVYLNNQPVREARLSDGDILNIGRFQFICYEGFPTDFDQEPEKAEDVDLLIEGRDHPQPVHLRTLLIGRRPKCEVRLDDAGVSNVHALIYRCDGRRFLRDLNSKHGTFLNNQRIREVEIRPGDVIRVGETIIRCERATQSQRGGWVPLMAAEEAAPLRLADEDEGSLEPMTDSSLDRALAMTDEIEVSARVEESATWTEQPIVILAAPASEAVRADKSNVELPLPSRLDRFADALASVEAEAPLEDIFASLENTMFEEAPNDRNVDRPLAEKTSLIQPEPRRHIDMPLLPPAAGGDDPLLADEVTANLLEDGFLREAWQSTPGKDAAIDKQNGRPTSPPARPRIDPERCESLDFPVEF